MAEFIQEDEALAKYCQRHMGADLIGFDTEFVREKTYYPKLEVVQIIVEDEIAIVDCQAIRDASPMWDLLCHPDSRKVLHSGLQDMEIMLQESGRLPAPIFDTQIAASLLGYGSQCGYSRLVYQILGKKVPKGETFSDWSHRPLHKDQLIYAEKDVEHLPEIYGNLVDQLKKRGRLSWIDEECCHLSEEATHFREPPETCYKRVKGRNSLDSTSLSVLRSLSKWREITAQEKNLPPGRILRDHLLLSIAKGRPKSLDQLKRQRGMHSGDISRFGNDILHAVQEGERLAETDPIELSPSLRTKIPEDAEAILKLLSAVLRIEAEKADVAPTVVATSEDLRQLVGGFSAGNLQGHPLLEGWRRELAGDRLLSVLEGKVLLRFNPKKMSIVLEESHG
ncbi:MAG: ribonuclease D [Candidatus Omnitrophica bacterium]|nr:ribonuclease D [Candidatus Omnitrophota bacterium]